MPEYRILPDDRGWPMAHAVLADGCTDSRAAGALHEASPVTVSITIAGNFVPEATVIVSWFQIEGEDDLVPLEWEIRLSSPVVAESYDPVAVVIAGRSATAAWSGVNRLTGRTPFPFSRGQWLAAVSKPA